MIHPCTKPACLYGLCAVHESALNCTTEHSYCCPTMSLGQAECGAQGHLVDPSQPFQPPTHHVVKVDIFLQRKELVTNPLGLLQARQEYTESKVGPVTFLQALQHTGRAGALAVLQAAVRRCSRGPIWSLPPLHGSTGDTQGIRAQEGAEDLHDMERAGGMHRRRVQDCWSGPVLPGTAQHHPLHLHLESHLLFKNCSFLDRQPCSWSAASISSTIVIAAIPLSSLPLDWHHPSPQPSP